MKGKARSSHLLNDREQEIVQRLANGFSDQQIADELFLSLHTVKWYNRQIYSKLGVNSRTQAIACVKDLGLLDSSDMESPQTDSWMGGLPFPRNPFFLGREEVLTRLRHHLQAGQTMAVAQPQAICGLGGVGKTQVALEYAYRYAQDYQAIFWTKADTRDTLVAGFLEVASMMCLPERNEQDQRLMIAAVKAWLSQHAGWLLILDNADDLALLSEFLPSPLSGHLLLTTRAQAPGGLANRVELETLDLDDATLLLLRRAGLLGLDASLAQAEPADWQAAVLLAGELGCLPLALDQAGAYLEETRCGLQQYLELYRSHRARLLRHRGGVASDHPDPVATTWSLSFAMIEQRSALASDLLRVCAVLHPDAIPEALFLRAAAHLGPALTSLEADPLAFNQALAVIQNYSLLRRNGREQTLSMHRLVQAVLSDAMSEEERKQWRRRAIAALDLLFPSVRREGWEQWEACSHLLPHVLSVTASTAPETHSLELAALLTRAADYLGQRAQYEQAEPLYQRALSICEQALEHEHPRVAFPLYGLADLYREQGRYREAEPLYQRALAIRSKLRGTQHLETADSLYGLARLHERRNQPEQALELYQRALRIREQRLGPEHPDTLETRACYAQLLRLCGRLEEAAALETTSS